MLFIFQVFQGNQKNSATLTSLFAAEKNRWCPATIGTSVLPALASWSVPSNWWMAGRISSRRVRMRWTTRRWASYFFAGDSWVRRDRNRDQSCLIFFDQINHMVKQYVGYPCLILIHFASYYRVRMPKYRSYLLPSGELTFCHGKWPFIDIYSGFSH